MKTKCRARCALNVGRWASYAAAGAATAIAAANDTEAAILYSGVLNTPVGAPPAEVFLNTLISNSHQGAFKLGYMKHLGRGSTPGFPGHPGKPASYGLAYFEMLKGASYFHAGPVAGQVRGYHTVTSNSRFASKLASHAPIAGGPFLSSGKDDFVAAYFKGFGAFGAFKTAGTGFVGFEFNTGGGVQYGWAKVNMTSGEPLNNFTLVSYAYGTPGQAITVGQTATPEPASLGLLALGAVGLLFDRAVRKRKPRPSVD